jgi:hypothetical protein
MKTYLCGSSGCGLGTPGTPGRFTGGISKEQVHLLTGRPLEQLKSGEDYGPGFCPNCGAKGKEE